jgi:ADP-heptose:LPS heptosyltransferase
MKFLVIRFSSFGDVILATTVFSYLNSTFPGSELWFVTGKKYSELFTRDPRLARVIGVDDDNDGAAITETNELSGIEWDRIIDLQNDSRSMKMRRRLVSLQPAGIFDKLHWNRFLLLALRQNRYSPENHVIARYARAAGNPGPVYPPTALYIDRTAPGGGPVDRFMTGDGMVRPMMALFPFSSWKNKEWSIAKFCFIGRYFAVKGWQVIIFGGPQDSRPADDLCARIGDHCATVAGKLSLYESACLIDRCSLALGVDTGLSHCARACGVKTGIIYGATTWHFGFFPYKGLPYRVFETSLWCRPCHAHGGNFCFRGSRKCLAGITPETVIAGLMELYHEN